MTIQLNGEQRDVPDGLTLAGLIEWLDLPADRVAVERNLEVVKRSNWNETRIDRGDRLEIVRMVGGGSVGSVHRGSGDFPCIPL
ncbi:MAG: sulfur carrier protein ThiS [Acidobacteriota bacterium]